ncbi:MAG: hypothetical protein DRH08_10590 [Deltaproteobacteria bacterium]|nr:MAG: hypothetical protein DRH08_10590 [Deltaproteobacteria bacterium]
MSGLTGGTFIVDGRFVGGVKYIPANGPESAFNSSSYSPRFTFQFPGSSFIQTINSLTVTARAQGGGDSYDIRIVDSDTGLVVAENLGLTNLTFEIIDMFPVSNIPSDPTIFEVQTRKDGGGSSNRHYIINSALEVL